MIQIIPKWDIKICSTGAAGTIEVSYQIYAGSLLEVMQWIGKLNFGMTRIDWCNIRLIKE